MSIFPLFYKKDKESFFKKNYLKLNFLMTDETHLGNSLQKSILDLFKVKKMNNTLSAESLISFSSIIQNFFKSLSNYYLIQRSNKFTFIVNGINCSTQFRNLFYMSLHNYNKLNIYKKDLKKFFMNEKLKNFTIIFSNIILDIFEQHN